MAKRTNDESVAEALRALVQLGKHKASSDVHRGIGKPLQERSRCDAEVGNGKQAKSEASPVSSRRSRQPHTVEALMLSDVMYLKDPETFMVYSTDRDSAGDLVAVGKWDGERIVERKFEHTKEPHRSVLRVPNTAPHGVSQRRGTLHKLNFDVTDPADHCETCVDSYRDPVSNADILDVLTKLCKELGKDASALRIYDPYYCTGSTKRHLACLGYTNVYNENEDFYEKISAESVPEFDILITNPPFSGAHVSKLIEYLSGCGRPWALLMPSYVAKKDFYVHMVSESENKPFYVVPKKRYVFYTPKGVNRGSKRFNKRGRTSPYVTIWFIQAKALNSAILSEQKRGGGKQGCRTRTYCDVGLLPADLF